VRIADNLKFGYHLAHCRWGTGHATARTMQKILAEYPTAKELPLEGHTLTGFHSP
jgi:hypothetical protein